MRTGSCVHQIQNQTLIFCTTSQVALLLLDVYVLAS